MIDYDINACLQPTAFCDPLHPDIQSKAKEIVGTKTGRDAVDTIFQWVRENVEYKIIGVESAHGTLHRRQGCCVAKSNLTVALSRSIGFPARYLEFEGQIKSPQATIEAHNLIHYVPEIFVDGRWINGDPAYESGLDTVYETGELEKTTWFNIKWEKHRLSLPHWLWPIQRIFVYALPGPWKVRKAIEEGRKNKTALTAMNVESVGMEKV